MRYNNIQSSQNAIEWISFTTQNFIDGILNVDHGLVLGVNLNPRNQECGKVVCVMHVGPSMRERERELMNMHKLHLTKMPLVRKLRVCIQDKGILNTTNNISIVRECRWSILQTTVKRLTQSELSNNGIVTFLKNAALFKDYSWKCNCHYFFYVWYFKNVFPLLCYLII